MPGAGIPSGGKKASPMPVGPPYMPGMIGGGGMGGAPTGGPPKPITGGPPIGGGIGAEGDTPMGGPAGGGVRAGCTEDLSECELYKHQSIPKQRNALCAAMGCAVAWLVACTAAWAAACTAAVDPHHDTSTCAVGSCCTFSALKSNRPDTPGGGDSGDGPDVDAGGAALWIGGAAACAGGTAAWMTAAALSEAVALLCHRPPQAAHMTLGEE
eukprot:353596-Chlamydomonas_euryale.AAC.5